MFSITCNLINKQRNHKMSVPKLTYFEATALGEPIRYIFAYGGIEYEDYRIKKENWPELKSNYPFGQLPVLEVDGKVINQHMAIARYAAKQANLRGDNDLEDAVIDAVVDSIHDFRLKLVGPLHEKHEESKKAKKEKLEAEIIPEYIKHFETILARNNGYFALGRLTWADLYAASMKESFEFVAKGFLEKSPKLAEALERTRSIPSIKKWIETRPKTAV